MNKSISLYFHIPFCVKKCNYCAFYSVPSPSPALVNDYCDALMKQFRAFKATEAGINVKSVYFGGGTPTVLGRDRLCGMLSEVISSGIIDNNCEVTVETNPLTADSVFFKGLISAGANRISVGVQSLVDSELRTLGRIHSALDAEKCIDDAKKVGFENVSADMIFGFNGHTMVSAGKTLHGLLSLGVKHIAAYSLQYEPGTPMYALKNAPDAVTEDDEEAIYYLICDIMRDNGFRHYEISAFAKDDDHVSHHNLGYWQRREYFGFGAAAHSCYNGKRFCAEQSIEKFIKTADCRSPFAPTDYEGVKMLTEDEIREESIMLGLRTDNGIDMSLISNARFAEKCVRSGLAVIKQNRFILTERGYRVSNSVIAELI